MKDAAIISGKTRLLGIVGWPVEHSLSPLMQNAALRAAGLDFVYVPFSVMPERLPDAVAGLCSLHVAGFNVTIPHKTAIIPLLDGVSPEAALIGAVNTVKREGDRLVGYNTDAPGFLASLRTDLGFNPLGSRVLVVGAGGAARAAVAALCGAGAASVTVANRNMERAHQIVDRFHRQNVSVELSAASLEVLVSADFLGRIDLLVNTTSVGMKGTSFGSFDLSLLKPDVRIYDMVYVPCQTDLLLQAERRGLRGVNGLGMLVAQGEEAYRIWTGENVPPGVMRHALSSALEGLHQR